MHGDGRRSEAFRAGADCRDGRIYPRRRLDNELAAFVSPRRRAAVCVQALARGVIYDKEFAMPLPMRTISTVACLDGIMTISFVACLDGIMGVCSTSMMATPVKMDGPSRPVDPLKKLISLN